MTLFKELQKEIKKDTLEQTKGIMKKIIKSSDTAVKKRIEWIEERQRQLKTVEVMLVDFEKKVNDGSIVSQDDLDEFFEVHPEAHAIVVQGKTTSTKSFSTGGAVTVDGSTGAVGLMHKAY